MELGSWGSLRIGFWWILGKGFVPEGEAHHGTSSASSNFFVAAVEAMGGNFEKGFWGLSKLGMGGEAVLEVGPAGTNK